MVGKSSGQPGRKLDWDSCGLDPGDFGGFRRLKWPYVQPNSLVLRSIFWRLIWRLTFRHPKGQKTGFLSRQASALGLHQLRSKLQSACNGCRIPWVWGGCHFLQPRGGEKLPKRYYFWHAGNCRIFTKLWTTTRMLFIISRFRSTTVAVSRMILRYRNVPGLPPS